MADEEQEPESMFAHQRIHAMEYMEELVQAYNDIPTEREAIAFLFFIEEDDLYLLAAALDVQYWNSPDRRHLVRVLSMRKGASS